MKNGRKHKRILISIFLTLLTNVLCIPLWTECNYGGLVRTLFNKEARLDFVYRGKITETKPFRLNASKPAPSYHWEHGVETKTKRANGSLRARKNWQKTSLLLEALQDGQISVVLMGPVSRDEYGQFYSVLTDWRNLKINGEVIFGDSKTLSLKKYFAKRIPVKEHETLQIEVEFRRHHFTIDDFTFLTAQNFWYLVSGNLLFFFLVYCLVSWSYWTHRGQSRPSDTLLVKRDIIKLISDCYLNVNAVYRRAFWIIFGVLCFAFGFHAIQFMWGNHDWTFLLSDLSWVHFQHIGRYSLTFFRKLFLGGIYLPFIYDIISFLFLALNAVLLCVYWKLQKRVSYFVLCGLILTAQPFTLGLIYYVHMVPETFIGVTFVLVALIISEKFAFEKSSLFKKSALSVLSITLINLSLASYPVLINT